jgi:hypothetical protein
MAELDLFARPELISRTARFREIEKLEKVYLGKQYDGRADWWTGTRKPGEDEVPLRERKPCIIYRLPKAATEQVVRFLFGEKRFPKISFEVNDGDSSFPAVSDSDAAALQKWTATLIEHAQVQPGMRAIAKKAIACKTSVVIVELEDGKFRLTLPRPQDCHVQFQTGSPDKPVEKLVWCYQFDKEVADESGAPCERRHIFRREWDTSNVYVYEDVEIVPGKTIEWGAPTVAAHGLSFCPVLWIRNETDHCEGVDGESLYEGLIEEFEALDMSLSRRHQGIIYLGAPQLVETGVEPGDGPDATGRKAGPEGYSGGEYAVAPKARRIAPDSVWTYEGEKVSVELVETSGKAFEVGTAHVNDIRSRVLETMGVVLTSMADTVSRVTTGADMSARFLALAHAPLIALVQEYRHTWWPKGLRPILSMMMRMTHEATRSGQMVAIPGTDKVAGILARFSTASGWQDPIMTAHWGKFFDPSSQEISTSVDATVKAKDGGLISHETAVEFNSHDFGVDSVETEMLEIEADEAKAVERETAELKRLGLDDGGKQPQSDPKTPQESGDNGRTKDGKDDVSKPSR